MKIFQKQQIVIKDIIKGKIEKVDVYDDDEAYILNDDGNMDDNIEGDQNNEEYYENNNPHQDNLNELEDFDEELNPNNVIENNGKNNLLTNSLEDLNSQIKGKICFIKRVRG